MQTNKNLGFTMLELLAAVGLLSILIALAVPEFSSLKGQMQASEDIRRLAGVLQQVRGESIRLRTFSRINFTSSSASWDFYNDGNIDGTIQFGPNSSFTSIPNALVFDGLGLARGVSGEQVFTITNRNQATSISINSNGYIER